MSSDCTVKIDDGILNIRVGAIIMKDNKILMVGNDKDKFLYSVGGRIKFGETAEEAVIREVFEETGHKLEIDRLGFVHENFFHAKFDKNTEEKKLFHEISLFFYMKTPKCFEPVCKSFSGLGNKEKLMWISPKTDYTIYPEFFKTELTNPSESVKHFVTDER